MPISKKTKKKVAPKDTRPFGCLYWQYYQNNRWKYGNRSETKDFKNDDIETWSLEKITEETVKQHQLSLQNKEELQKIKIDIFDAITFKGNALGENYRPTLYDFLAHRAADFFMSDEPGITKPVYAFVIDKAAYIADAQEFNYLKLETKDELSYKFFALQILQFSSNTKACASFPKGFHRAG